MNIIIDKECDIDLGFDADALINRVINASLDYVECPYECEVYVTLTDNDTIHQINMEHRKMDMPTDVLSFPLIQYDEPAIFTQVDDDVSAFNFETGELLLGDIIISMEKVIAQAEEYNHSTKRELAFLVAHSILHLVGYDHIDEKERIVMEEKQKEILNNLGITRD